jgi:hypothetical protein
MMGMTEVQANRLADRINRTGRFEVYGGEEDGAKLMVVDHETGDLYVVRAPSDWHGIRRGTIK